MISMFDIIKTSKFIHILSLKLTIFSQKKVLKLTILIILLIMVKTQIKHVI